MKVTQQDIIKKTRGFAKDIFGKEFTLPIDFSGRMTRALGYFSIMTNRFTGEQKPKKIQYATRLLDHDYKEETIDSIILHELTHWFLFVSGQEFRDGTYRFESELKRIGGSSTRTIASAADGYETFCTCCGKKWISEPKRYEKMKRHGGYVSNCCRAKLRFGKFVEVEDKFERARAKEQWIEDVIASYSVANLRGEVTTLSKVQMPKVEKQLKVAEVEKVNETSKNKRLADKMTFHELFDYAKTTGKKISNVQMIPAIRLAIDTQNKDDLKCLKATYPAIYEGSLRYIGKGYTAKLEKLF